MKLLKHVLSWLIRLLLVVLLAFSAYYIYFIQTEKFESTARVMIKDLSSKTALSPFGSLLSVGTSEGLQDATLLEFYISSYEMYDLLDQNFSLSEYYTSDKIDTIHRLREDSPLLMLMLNKNNLLNKYHEDLKILYDEPSSSIAISFSHADANMSKKIVKTIVFYATEKINFLEKENTTVMLNFLKEQEVKKYQEFISSMEVLLAYQSKNRVFDPKIDIESKSSMIAQLEMQLIQKEVAYNGMKQYMNLKSSEMLLAKDNIVNIKNKINKIKNEITGAKGKKELNINLSNFELLKSKVEFNKEIYRQTLIKLEETKVSVSQNAKNLIVLIDAAVADAYTSPNKPKETLSIWIILLFVYGIVGMIVKLIQDHKD